MSGLFLVKKRRFLKKAGIDTWENFRASLEKRGVRSILVVGKISHVSESIGFSSPTGPQRPKTSPRDPPDQTPRRFKKNTFFKTLMGGSWGRPWGSVWVSGGQFGLEKPIDSLTRRLAPTTKIDLTPVFSRLARKLSHVSMPFFENSSFLAKN